MVQRHNTLLQNHQPIMTDCGRLPDFELEQPMVATQLRGMLGQELKRDTTTASGLPASWPDHRCGGYVAVVL